MFVASSCELCQVYSNYALGSQIWPCLGCHLFLFVEGPHPVNFVNITHVKSNETAETIKIHSWTLRGALLSCTFINSHSQVSNPWPKGHLVFFLISLKILMLG